ncbi:hypothetical protein ACQUFY_04610 [Robbsia andropogonis]|uniref:hypothetical protein n=1 Tax=Robbsia andropogonis TaxID=28092 RepID=UPI003D2544CF
MSPSEHQLAIAVHIPPARASADKDRLRTGMTVRTRQAGRIGSVVHVYSDGSGSIRWHDKPSIALDLGHERVPRAMLDVVEECAERVDVRAICLRALRAAAMASTYQEALDVAGEALRTVAAMSRREVRHG